MKQHDLGVEKKRNHRKIMKEEPEREEKASQGSWKSRIVEVNGQIYWMQQRSAVRWRLKTARGNGRSEAAGRICQSSSSVEVETHIMMKTNLNDFEHNVNSMGNECNCLVDWTFFSIALLGTWDKDWSFPVLWPLLGFPNLLIYWVHYFKSFRILNSSVGIPSPPLAL